MLSNRAEAMPRPECPDQVPKQGYAILAASPVAIGGSLSSNLGLVVEEERYVAATQTPLVRPSPLAFASSATRAHRSMLRFSAGCCAVSRPEHRHLHQSTHDPDPRRWEGREL